MMSLPRSFGASGQWEASCSLDPVRPRLPRRDPAAHRG
jgi:hypothetical protein